MTVVRTAAWSAAQQAVGWTDSFVWYAVAIREMKALTLQLEAFRPLALEANALRARRNPTQADRQRYGQLLNAMLPIIRGWSDPRSLGYQAQVHDSFLPPDLWPTFSGAPVLWHECAHANWFFLPWHRAYLLEFESVARAHVVRLGGPADWALPYWNSSDYRTIPDAASLPLALQDSELPAGLDLATEDGQPDPERTNPLFEPSRTGPAPLSQPPSADDWPDATAALKRHHFANAQDQQQISFGGGYVEDLTFFHFADEIGQIDAQPHGVGHSLTGGLMGAFSTAGLDPVFWLHHANVDRLWETYAKDQGHGYPFPNGRPTSPGVERDAYDSWAEREFRFLRPDATVVTWKAPEVFETEDLGYRYDTIVAPQFNVLTWQPSGQDVQPFGAAPRDFTPVAAAEQVAIADATAILLTGGEPGEDGRDLVADGTLWNVRFDGLRCEAPAETPYAVYLGLEGDQPDPTRLIGVLSLFGVFEASIEADGNTGRSRLLEATGVVRALDAFEPFAARLTLVPSDTNRDLAAVGLVVERISLEVAG